MSSSISAILVCAALLGPISTDGPAAGDCPPPIVASDCVHGVPLGESCAACVDETKHKTPTPIGWPPLGREVDQAEGNGGPEPMALPVDDAPPPLFDEACCCDQSDVVRRLNEITATLGELRGRQGEPLGTKYALAEVRKFHAELANLDRKTNDLQASLAAGRAAVAAMGQRIDGAAASLAAHENKTDTKWQAADETLQRILQLLLFVLVLAVIAAAFSTATYGKAAIAIALLACCGTARADGLSDCVDATCRVSVDGGIGTGCVFHRDATTWYVLTNCHVAERPGTACKLEFWVGGFQSPPVPGRTVSAWLNDRLDQDIAIVAVADAAFPGRLRPKVIPLAPRGTKVAIGATVCSVGCAEGKWATAWKGNVCDLPRPHVFHARPAAANGRSGSAVFDAEAKQIVGLIAWRDEQAGAAVAQNLDCLYGAFDGRAAMQDYPPRPRGLKRMNETSRWPLLCAHGVPIDGRGSYRCKACEQEAQCGPGGCAPQWSGSGGSCGPGGCRPFGGGGDWQGPPQQPDRGGDYAGGQSWQGFDPWRDQGPQPPLPTPQPVTPVCPTPTQPAAGCDCDIDAKLAEVHRRLDQLAEADRKLTELVGRMAADSGLPGPAGPRGEQGPRGEPGPPGQPAESNAAAIAALTVQIEQLQRQLAESCRCDEKPRPKEDDTPSNAAGAPAYYDIVPRKPMR